MAEMKKVATRDSYGAALVELGPPAVQVELIDHRNPSKNGVYLVEEVTTNFGVGGYRQQLSIPYKIKK